MKVKLLNLLFILSLASAWGQVSPKQFTWNINRTDSIGGFPVTVLGQPKIVEKEGHTAVEFNGKTDGLLVDGNPMIGATEFTIEVVFMVYEGGPKEQRFVHFQQNDNNRILVELRMPASNKWFLDTFIKSGASNQVLYSEGMNHDADKWNHACLVYKDNTMTHYVDGVKELSKNVTYTSVSSGKTSIGVRMNRVSWFNGAIRLLRITHQALPPEKFLINENTFSTTNPVPALSNHNSQMFLGKLFTIPLTAPGEIKFSVNEPGNYRINIFSISGKKQTIFEKYLESGSYSTIITSTNLVPGLYFYKLSNSQASLTR